MKKVIMAMSGGIDSSVAAALLKKQGYDVIGVFMKFFGGKNRCCSPESERRARLVAAKLGIPFYVFNFKNEFKKKVVDYFLKEYKSGRTPNPCVVCNKEIKFGLLFKKMLSLDADYIATGHYARKRGTKLLKAKDQNKDQSYFLWKLNQKILKKALFPIGDYTKTEVRSLARGFKLPVLDVPESMEICFIQTTINDFLRKHLKTRPGKIIDTKGKTIGEHQGLWFYTIGQRKGIRIAGAKPHYVLDKDIKKNILIVTQNKKDLYKKELNIKEVNWIHPVKCRKRHPAYSGIFNRVKVKIRYGHKPVPAVVQGNKVIFNKPQQAVTPGQSVVFYSPSQIFRRKTWDGKQELLGGAVIRA